MWVNRNEVSDVPSDSGALGTSGMTSPLKIVTVAGCWGVERRIGVRGRGVFRIVQLRLCFARSILSSLRNRSDRF